MLEYNEITLRKYIVFEKEPWEVLDAHVFRKQQRKPVNATKLKNLLNGRVMEHSFHVSDKVEEAEIITKKAKYLYNNRGEWWFTAENDPSNRYKIEQTLIGDASKFMKPNMTVETLQFEDKIFGVKLPIKIDLIVKEAPPAVRGDTAKGGNKVITLETGATITAPMFINPDDVIRVNTETGEYVERVTK